MKSTFFLCLVTFVTFVYSDEPTIEVSDNCVNEIMDNMIAAERCMDEQNGTPVDIFHQLVSIVHSYNHSDDDYTKLIEFADKNCMHLPKIVDCLRLTFRNTVECPRPNKQQDSVRKVFYKGVETITNYVCANNFDVIRKLIPNDGLKFLLINDDFDKCFEGVTDRYIDHTGQICPLIDLAAPCVLKVIGDHPNENVYIAAEEIIKRFREVANCDRYNFEI